jgi:outer membrane protein TolC
MKHKLSVVIVLALMISLQSAAQEKKVLGLNEAIELSVKNSKQLKRDQARIDEATAALREATDKRLPDAGLSGSYLRFNSPNIVMDTKSSGGGSGISADRPKINQFMYGIASFSLPIYSGGQIKYGINSAEYLQKAVALDADNEREEVVQTTIEAFANLFKATTAVRLMKENLAQSQQRVKELTNLEKNGLLARNDLLKAELQSSNIELSLLDAENNRRIANVNMNLMLGISTKTELVLDTAGVVKKQDDRVLDDYLNAAVQNRKDIAAYENRKKAAESGHSNTKRRNVS